MINYSSINDAWGNKEIYKKNNTNISPVNIQPVNIPPVNIQPVNIPVVYDVVEKFTDKCELLDHIINCEKCKNKMVELFANEQPQQTMPINIFGLNVTNDVLKILFIIIICVIFVLLLSMVNSSLTKPVVSEMKYFVMPNNANQMYKLIAQ
jgi:hypothetical protein